jgi:ATP-dependent RNA/DNA helicase IGHMBP2
MMASSVDDAIHEFCTWQKVWLETELHAGENGESGPLRNEDVSSKSKQPHGGGKKNQAAADAGGERTGIISSAILTKLESRQISVGLYGRTVVQLGRLGDELLLPVHKFTTGDEVEIRNSSSSTTSQRSSSGDNNNTIGGVVCEVTETSLSIALFSSQKGSSAEPEAFFDAPPFAIIPRSNVQVHNKMMKALADLQKMGSHHPVAGKVVEALFRKLEIHNKNEVDGTIIIAKATEKEPTTIIQPFNPRLDASQLEAISFALSSKRPVALIHGPVRFACCCLLLLSRACKKSNAHSLVKKNDAHLHFDNYVLYTFPQPGTGKTTTVAELIQQAVRYRQMKVLVVAASNVAVDTLLARLVVASDTSSSSTTTIKPPKKQSPLRLVRLGHPARLQPAILPYCLEALVQRADGTEIVDDVRNELQQYLKILATPRGRGDKRIAAREVKTLRKEIRTREEKVVTELIRHANVVLATCVGAANTKLLSDDVTFDLVVIDEAAQALEAACWIAILRGRKLVLAGDHLQLPPTIMSTAVQPQLGVTLFERVMSLYGDTNGADGRISRMLKVQYRMNENIANWASVNMYGGALSTYDGIRHQTIGQLECVVVAHKTGKAVDVEDNDVDVDEEEAFPSMLLIDTAGCDLVEAENASGSRCNEGEADLVVTHVKKLLDLGVPQEEVAVISPYNGQVELLRLRLLAEYPKLQIRSVDGFQGGGKSLYFGKQCDECETNTMCVFVVVVAEREAVVISLVRSHPFGSGSIGFLRDDRRLNVAITRAKRHCCVICDTDTVSKSAFIKSLIDWIDEHGVHQTADGDPILGDLAAVEKQLESFIGKPRKDSKSFATKKQRTPRTPQKDEEYIEKQRVILKSHIETFVASAKPGETMIMSHELSKLDRKIVHEIAEELGVEHVSYGEEGANRQIHLKMPPVADDVIAGISHPLPKEESLRIGDETAADTGGEDETEAMKMTNTVALIADNNDVTSDDELPQATKTVASFSILDDDEQNDETQERSSASTPATSSATTTASSENPTTLADLARERRQRAEQKPQQVNVINPKPKITIENGKRLGGTKNKLTPKVVEKDDNTLDDMAFLDAQIDQVQNSHGVAFEGKGKTYRTVVNGILLHKNKAPEPKKNAKASQSLQTKLQEAQKQRAAKPSSKKH